VVVPDHRDRLDIIASAMTKDVNELWGLGLLTGISEIVLAFQIRRLHATTT